MYSKTTHRINVSVLPVFIDERSDPARNHYFWAYQVTIINNNPFTVKLISRYWHITDANGAIEEVSGSGVVGEQPTLLRDGKFEYTSGCPLKTPSGIMVGHYEFEIEGSQMIRVDIPAFSLDLPDAEPIYN